MKRVLHVVTAIFALTLAASPAVARSAHDRPWKDAQRILVIDPYQGNRIDWDAAATDPTLRAVLHRASIGTRTDTEFVARATEARKRGLLWGAYHLGLKGDAVAQADLLIRLARQTNTTFLALDIEAIGGNNMSLEDAEIFISRVYEKTGRYPALYVNWSVYEEISRRYDRSSIFARTPLWIARFIGKLPQLNGKVWDDYTLWQFASELNCPEAIRQQNRPSLCEPYRPYKIPGTAYDMDINVFNGDAAALRRLFGGPAGA